MNPWKIYSDFWNILVMCIVFLIVIFFILYKTDETDIDKKYRILFPTLAIIAVFLLLNSFPFVKQEYKLSTNIETPINDEKHTYVEFSKDYSHFAVKYFLGEMGYINENVASNIKINYICKGNENKIVFTKERYKNIFEYFLQDKNDDSRAFKNEDKILKINIYSPKIKKIKEIKH